MRRTASGPALLADVGGTHTRLALSSKVGRLDALQVVHTADYDAIEQAIADYLAAVAPDPRPARALLAVAGPVTGNAVRLTNADWDIDGDA
ncbi:MAG TPA: glucokinase, partial [Thalassobaculum sp.]